MLVISFSIHAWLPVDFNVVFPRLDDPSRCVLHQDIFLRVRPGMLPEKREWVCPLPGPGIADSLLSPIQDLARSSASEVVRPTGPVPPPKFWLCRRRWLGQRPTIGTEGQTGDVAIMPHQDFHDLAGRKSPQAYAPVLAQSAATGLNRVRPSALIKSFVTSLVWPSMVATGSPVATRRESRTL